MDASFVAELAATAGCTIGAIIGESFGIGVVVGA